MEWTALRSHQELHWTNEPKEERIELRGADRLSAQAGAMDRSWSRYTVIHSAGRYIEESSRIRRRIIYISDKSSEKHSNSALNC